MSVLTPLQQRTLQIAKRHIGESEDLGPNRGTKIVQFQMWFGKWMLGQPWCAAFATYCIYHAAMELKLPQPHVVKSASSSAIYDDAVKDGTLIQHPEGGCIGLVKAGIHAAPGKSHEHTFLVHTVEDDGKTVLTVEGNWSNRVRWNRRTVTSNYHWVRIS